MQKVFVFALLIGVVQPGFSQPSYQESRDRQLIIPNRENSEWAMKQPYVVLISIDGFRYDYAEKYQAKNILKLAGEGASARRMIPTFPSKTFPNHYTLVTGLYAGNHGIVANEFYSRSRDEWYSIPNSGSVQDGSWYSGKPLWVLAEEQRMLSASYFWIGSEAEIGGIRPTYYYPYSSKIPNAYRYQQAIEWLELEPEYRPHFISVYFSIVDDAGHNFGPDALETKRAVLEMDSLLGAFREELTRFSYDITVILVSDHGMATIGEGIVLSEVVDLKDSKVSWSFPPMIYQENDLVREEIYQTLMRNDKIQVWKKESLPLYFNYQNEDRVGDLILLTESPVVVIQKPEEVLGGAHGFDPFGSKEMSAIFHAAGPRINAGFSIETVENIHVYPFVAHLLGLQITHTIDGELRFLEPAILGD